jgi:hypothetical protein
MPLNYNQINNNYLQTLQLARKSIATKLSMYGREANISRAGEDLAQSVCGHPDIARLIKTETFDTVIYERILRSVVEELAREFYPDARKRRFVSLSDMPEELLMQQAIEVSDVHRPAAAFNKKDFLNALRGQLPAAACDFLETVILRHTSGRGAFTAGRLLPSAGNTDEIIRRMQLMMRLYADGRIPDTSAVDGRRDLEERQIIDCYRNVYCGIERRYPLRFLERDAPQRAAVITRYLVDQILQTTPEAVLQQCDADFALRHKLQNVYRFFNCSANRMLTNAWPDRIPHWLYSRAKPAFWENAKNRQTAVRWLVESRLQIQPDKIKLNQLTRRDFSGNGLSYLFNTYYNSVGRALGEAYPTRQPWELGNVSAGYWTNQTTAAAIRWMVEKEGWPAETLPDLYEQGTLTVKTFAKHGLTTLIDKNFQRNLFRAMDCAFPEKFHPWQFGQLPAAYWRDPENLAKAGKWLARQYGLGENEVVAAIRNRRFGFEHLPHNKLAGLLKKITADRIGLLFMPGFYLENIKEAAEQRLLLRIKNLIRHERYKNMFVRLLLFGVFAPLITALSGNYLFRLERMKRRISRRMQVYSVLSS